MPNFLDINAPCGHQYSDIPYNAGDFSFTGKEKSSRHFLLSENEKVAINTAISTFDRKYRTSILEKHEANPNFREVAAEVYPLSLEKDIATLADHSVGLRTFELSNSSTGRNFINHVAYHMQGFASAIEQEKAEDLYDQIFSSYDRVAVAELAEIIPRLQPFKHAAPLLETAVRKRLMMLAFGVVDRESLFEIPFSWLIKSADMSDLAEAPRR